MAKVTKTSQIELGKRLGSTHEKVSSISVEEIRVLGWKEMRDLAAQFAVGHAEIPDSPYAHDATEAFIDGFTGALGRKLKTYDNALKQYDRARTGISAEQAGEKIAELLRAMPIRGRVGIDANRICVMRGQIEVTVYFKWEREGGWGDTDCVRHPDDPQKRAGRYVLSAELSTGGRSYGMTEASVLSTLLTEMTSIANEILVTMQAGPNVVWTWPTEERKEA